MTLYKFNSNTLQYEIMKSRSIYTKLLILCGIFLCLGFSSAVKINTVMEKIPVILRSNEEEFSKENLRREIKRLNVKFPLIVLGQSEVETGQYKSPIFKINHNLFGMKVAKMRPSSNRGELSGHAAYKDWKESVTDMALWNAAYCKDINTEEEYYQLLKSMYAEDSNYVSKVKSVVERLKQEHVDQFFI